MSGASTTAAANPTRIKCCGMFRAQDVAAVNAARPDYCGFVVNVPSSHRSVSIEQLRELRALLDPGIIAVGVFVDEDAHTIAQLCNEGVLDMVQLHGAEDESYMAALHAHTEAPIIKAFKVRTTADIEAANESSADYVLLDGGAGDGKLFDWNLLAHAERPYFLAGGLTPETIPQAVATYAPFAVDISSGIETNKVKDADKIRAAVAAVRPAQNEERKAQSYD